MKSSHDLFQLIHSMSKGEKRRFRLYVKKYAKTSNYLSLFDTVEQQKEYDEARIRKKFAGETFIRRLDMTKEYLYGLILRSMRSQEDASFPALRVLGLCQDSIHLTGKGLHRQAGKCIKEAKNLCYHYELFEELLIVLRKESCLPFVNRKENFEEREKIITTLEHIHICGQFAEQLRNFTETRQTARTTSEIEAVDAILRSFPISSPEEAGSFNARLRYFFGYSRYYDMKRDYTAAKQYSRAIIELFHSNPQHIQIAPLVYISELRTLYTTDLMDGTPDQAETLIEQFRRVSIPEQFIPFKTLLLYLMELRYCCFTFQLDRALALKKQYPHLVKTCGQELSSYGVDIEIQFIYHFSSVHFLREEYGQALTQVHLLLAKPSLAHYQYIENSTKILLLILHYELGNMELLEYMIRSTYRFLLRRERLFAFERCFLQHLRLLTAVRNRKELYGWFKILYDEVHKLTLDPIEGNFYLRSECLIWLESKITGKTFPEILEKERLKFFHQKSADQL